MLKLRLITGSALIITVLAVFWFDGWLEAVGAVGGERQLPPGVPVFLLALACMPFAALELSTIFAAQGIRTLRWLTIVAAEAGLVVGFVASASIGAPTATTSFAIVGTGLFAVFVLSLLVFSRAHQITGVLAAAGGIVFTMLYLGLMPSFLLALRQHHSAWWIVGIILVTKSADIGAFFTGKAIGRHKLIPWLSPGKTWEGLIGGMVFAALTGLAAAAISGGLEAPADRLPLWVGAACGLAFAVVGLFGDLTMSLLKRGAGLKDASAILPGLGGVLDVLDSPLFVAPVSYWMLTALV